MEKRKKEQTMADKTLHIKLKIEQHETHLNPGVNSCAPEGLVVHYDTRYNQNVRLFSYPIGLWFCPGIIKRL